MSLRPMRYRPLFGRILTIAVTVLGTVAAGGLVIEGTWRDVVRYGPPTALLVVLAWALFWIPSLKVEEHAVTVRNILRTHHIPWPAIERIDTRFALTLFTRERRIPVWVAPAPSRHVVPHATRDDVRHVPESAQIAGSVRPGDLPTTDSGAAAMLLRTHWERLRDDGVFDRVTVPQRIRTEWDMPLAISIGVLVILTVLGFALV